ncbi:hypothetical protein ACG83_36025 [Frankia sp. R43]|uniref:peptidoglycan-binding domain-containing protein n=1 Tax=Frankia sp. R43 TaxID=269536 RepID=UPI0006CA3C64|nr:peptidoglycan-binding domain-containing protein [Frankia sp. R43]KPM50900.1 hypothetical protein ACG83_36025 [Frankia sp. R43]
MRGRRLRTSVITAAAALIVLAVAASVGFGWRGGGTSARTAPDRSTTTTIKLGTLVDYVTVDGSTGYGAGLKVASKADGTVTWLPDEGSTVERGQALLRVNDLPVVLLYGQLPMYRSLNVGVKGNDVAQFEQNLQALGYQGFTADQEFTASTGTAVKRWQRDLGLPDTGTVEPGQVIYAADRLRVSERLVGVGAAAPADVLSATTTTKVVTASVDESEAAWAVPGAPVTVTLPAGKTAAGTVSSAAQPSSSTGSEGGDSKVHLTVAVQDQQALNGVDGAVTIRHVVREKKGALTVPVAALLALAEGGYGLELVEGDSTRVVAAQVGMFAEGRVEVSGPDLRVGLTVELPQ